MAAGVRGRGPPQKSGFRGSSPRSTGVRAPPPSRAPPARPRRQPAHAHCSPRCGSREGVRPGGDSRTRNRALGPPRARRGPASESRSGAACARTPGCRARTSGRVRTAPRRSLTSAMAVCAREAVPRRDPRMRVRAFIGFHAAVGVASDSARVWLWACPWAWSVGRGRGPAKRARDHARARAGSRGSYPELEDLGALASKCKSPSRTQSGDPVLIPSSPPFLSVLLAPVCYSSVKKLSEAKVMTST